MARFGQNTSQTENSCLKASYIEEFWRLKERNKPAVLSDLEPGHTPTSERKDKNKWVVFYRHASLVSPRNLY